MQKVKLPLTVDPIKAAQRRLEYAGYYAPNQLERLHDSVSQVLGNAQATMSFEIDPQRLVVIKGNATIDVELICQRCGKPFIMTLASRFTYSPVSNQDQAEKLPEYYEPLEMNEFGEVDLLEVVEDELILALPLVPKHNIEHCEVSVAEQVFGDLPADAEKPNPFAVLANLKKQK
ncbi:23S rRNA accumulation protein YceD [Spirabiliibacterium falconis]|uniref:23S rRNA accumulation protein YceD n=1 Tax=Spirabiliibacterium falconis TaxID=572023 RepID=UPI001AAD0EDC|nr:23S rRNA accumulation protein YceD [Spirabiliibacterium falconis]MBE2894779.1 23S rRNA accumulation protein YceD [Spirabiliibacterium falconis]